MADRTQHAPGTFCWAELGTTDAGAAKAFYSALFGWTYHDTEAAPGLVYSMIQEQGKNAAALYRMSPEVREGGVSPHWMAYVAVASADGDAARARELGATVLAEPFDVLDVGRMAVLRDPTGATFAVWEARRHVGFGIVGEPGAVCWNELATRGTAAAGRFYAALFGWGTKVTAMPNGPYTEFLREGTSVAGMMGIHEDGGAVPPHWLVYFAVEDAAGVAGRAAERGGRALVPPTPIPGVGTFAILRDPQGAAFGILQPEIPPALSASVPASPPPPPPSGRPPGRRGRRGGGA